MFHNFKYNYKFFKKKKYYDVPLSNKYKTVGKLLRYMSNKGTFFNRMRCYRKLSTSQ